MVFTDKFDWGTLLTKFIFGVGVISLSAFSKGSSGRIIENDGNLSTSIIWRLVDIDFVYDSCHCSAMILTIVFGQIAHLCDYHCRRTTD
jgi:hypothetical protein